MTPVQKDQTAKAGIVKEHFGEVDNQPVYQFTLRNNKGAEVKIINYGGIVTSWVDADGKGNRSNIVLGFESLSDYLAGHPFFGAVAGRYANRIAHGKFTLDGIQYTLAANKGGNHLHGGNKGFDKVVWEAAISEGSVQGAIIEGPGQGATTTPELSLTYRSTDGEEGYPGNLNVNVRYQFTNDNELQIRYEATTDKATPINLTNHSYFNLTGDPANSIFDHHIYIEADHYTPINEHTIPTGEIRAVKDTAFDFTTPARIGDQIGQTEFGYDHNYVFNHGKSGLRRVVILSEATSGRKLEVFTDQPGMQFYSGNNLDGTFKTREGKPIGRQCALCLETQHFPNSPNEPAFPSTILRPGEQYRTQTTYRLSTNRLSTDRE